MTDLASRQRGGWFPGAVILVIGALLLLRNFGLPVPRLGSYWPYLLMAFGAYRLWTCGFRSFSGFAFLVAGALFALWELDVLPFHPWKLWPLLLVALGVRILRQATGAPAAGPLPGTTSGSVLNESAAFGGGERRIVTDDFKGGRVDVVFGGMDLDLTASAIKESPAVLNVVATFGGVDIRVPTGWAVTLRASSLFGGCDDKTLHPAPETNPPQLIVNGYAVFGGCEVKN